MIGDVRMAIQEQLLKILAMQREQNAMCERITRLRALAEGHTAKLTGMPRGGGKDWTDIIIYINNLEDELAVKKRELAELIAETTAVIAKMENTTLRELLEYRYLLGLNWGEISVAMRYDRTHVWRLHKKAIAAAEQAAKK